MLGMALTLLALGGGVDSPGRLEERLVRAHPFRQAVEQVGRALDPRPISCVLM